LYEANIVCVAWNINVPSETAVSSGTMRHHPDELVLIDAGRDFPMSEPGPRWKVLAHARTVQEDHDAGVDTGV
jgi:hypothetical protein